MSHAPGPAARLGGRVPMNHLGRLLALRLKALGRAVRDHAATVFVLGPLVLGTGLLLLARVARDVAAPAYAAGVEPWLWAAGGGAALFAVRPPAGAHADALVQGLPLPRATVWADRYLAALLRLSPVVAALAVVVAALGGGGARWGGLAALTALAPLVPLPRPRPARGTWRRAGLRGLVRGITAVLPAPLRPLVAHDLLLVGRGFSARAGVSLGLAGVALLASAERAWSAGADGGRVGLLAVAVAAWALASTVFLLWERQRITLWLLADLGCPARTIWRAKVVTAGLLGLVPGLAGAVPWAAVSVPVALTCPLLGGAVGIGVGAMLMEGDARPLLAGVVSLFVALGMGTLVILNPGLALAALPVAAYMERLALPRVARRLGEIAQEL